jgi:hypothetical protein
VVNICSNAGLWLSLSCVQLMPASD